MSNQTIEIRKLNSTVEVDFHKLPETAQAFIINYGLKQVLNDAHSQVVWKRNDGTMVYGEDTAEAQEQYAKDVMSAIDEKLEALQSGQITTRKAGTPKIVNPIEREAYRLVSVIILDAIKVQGLNKKQVENFNDLVTSHLEANKDEFFKQAKANLKARENAPVVEIDLSKLITKA